MKMTINGIEVETSSAKEAVELLTALSKQEKKEKKGGWDAPRWTEKEIDYLRVNLNTPVNKIVRELKKISGHKRTKPAIYTQISAVKTGKR